MAKKLPKYLTPGEVEALLNAPYKTNRHHILMLKFGLNCGMRSHEILKVRVKDMSLNGEGYPRIRILGKGQKERIVPIPYEFAKEIEKYIQDNNLGYEDQLFDMKPRGFRDMVKRYGVRAGLEKDIHPHILRHTYAVSCLKAGMNLRTLQKLLGHDHLSTTQIYLDVTGMDIADDFYNHPLPY